MLRSKIVRLISIGILTLVAVLGVGRPARADSTIVYTFNAGEACSFGLMIEARGANPTKTLPDKYGNVRTISAGRGSAFAFTNMATGATLSVAANGSVVQTTTTPDGMTTVVATGHDLLILFPTDVPAGPSTTLYVGRVVFTINGTTGVFTLQEARGQATDICAALAA